MNCLLFLCNGKENNKYFLYLYDTKMLFAFYYIKALLNNVQKFFEKIKKYLKFIYIMFIIKYI